MTERGQSNVSGTVLLVGVAVVLAAFVGGYLLTFGNNIQDNARGEVSVSQNPDGTYTVTLEDAKNSERVLVRDDDGNTWTLSESGEQITIQPGDKYVVIGERDDGTQTVINKFDYSDTTPVPTIVPVTTTSTSPTPTPTPTATPTPTPTATATPTPTPTATATPTPTPTPTATPTPTPTPTATPTPTPTSSGPTLLWTSDYVGSNELIVSNDTVYFATSNVGALNLDDGSVRWTQSPGSVKIMEYANGTVYGVTSPSGETNVHRYDSSTGNKAWTFTYGTQGLTGAIDYGSGGEVFLSGSGETIEIAASDGTENWAYSSGSGGSESLVVYEGSTPTVIAEHGGDLVSLKQDKGALESREQYKTTSGGENLVKFNGEVWSAGEFGSLQSNKLSDGTKTNDYSFNYQYRYNIKNGIAYGVDYNGSGYELVAIDLSDGSTKWTAPLGSDRNPPAYAPAIAGGKAYISISNDSTSGADLYAINTADGSIDWRYRNMSDNGRVTVSNGIVVASGLDMHALQDDHTKDSSGSICDADGGCGKN